MTNEATITALVYWLTNNTPVVIQLLAAITPVLALLLAGLIVYAVFWKGGRK